ncbi:MAG: hypothetical protein IKC09_09485 [Oscillospiraceae bacterium]|nr:hypothetical protein [Oscillospiraceae bacterium]
MKSEEIRLGFFAFLVRPDDMACQPCQKNDQLCCKKANCGDMDADIAKIVRLVKITV